MQSIANYGARSDRMSLKKEEFFNLPILLPCLEEQRKIADFLSTFDEKVEAKEQQLAALQDIKKGLLQQIFSQQLRFKDDHGLDYPEWSYDLLSSLVEINPKSGSLPETFLYIDLESVKQGKIISELQSINSQDAPSRAKRTVLEKDILFQTVRPYQQNNLFIKEIADTPFVASTGYAIFRALQGIYPLFIYYAVHNKSFLDDVLLNCEGATYPAIRSTSLSKLYLQVPCLEEQRKIADFLSAFDEKIEAVQAQLKALKDIKKGLLQQLFV